MELSTTALAAALFWSAGLMLAYTFVGYAFLMRSAARWGHRARAEAGRDGCPQPSAQLPQVTCVVVAFNESARIATRVENLLASDYPAQKLAVIVVSDGSTDDTDDRARALGDARVTVLEQPARAGKAAGLNAALAQCRSEIVVFADARQRFDARAISNLVRHFTDPAVGAVSGSLEIETAESGVGQAVDVYWRIEKRLREDEATLDSCIGCTGAIYAIRRECFVPIAEDTLLDDVVIPMQIAVQGRRVLHDPEALAFDPQSLEPGREQARKRRTLAGNFQMLFRHPQWLLPWRNRLWWQLVSHKYLRLIAPLLLIIVFAASVRLRLIPFYGAMLTLQVVFYMLAVVGMATGLKSRLFALPAGFVFLNAAVVRAFWHYLAGTNLHHWGAASGKSVDHR